MPRALFNGQVVAESDDTIVVEGNHYFPRTAVREDLLEDSTHHTICPWKGRASYRHVVVDGRRADNALWFYPHPLPLARRVRGRVAFWRGVTVEP